MRRSVFSALVAAGALWLGVAAILRGDYWLGGCLCAIAVLRMGMLVRDRKPKQRPQPAIRLDLARPAVLKYPKLPPHLKPQLDAITPGVDGELHYYPCCVRLRDGGEVDRVYLVSEAPYIRQWGVYPGQDKAKGEVRISEVASLRESGSRLPAEFANEIYRGGESGMGYTLFTVVFSDGSRQSYAAGNAIDFIQYPQGKGPADVSAVRPQERRNDPQTVEAPPYYWCIYSE